MSHVPDTLKPAAHEAAVLSMLAVREADDWALVCGSLLTVPSAVARTSWKRWAELQPATRGPRYDGGGFELGPVFCAEPFPGLRVCRIEVDGASWTNVTHGLSNGRLDTRLTSCTAGLRDWSSIVLLTQGGLTEAHAVVAGAERPVMGVVAATDPHRLPDSAARWDLVMPPHVRPGRELGEMFRHRHLLHWPKELLGINWLGSNDSDPPQRFVVGRTARDAWIADVVPDYDTGEIRVVVCWDEQLLDPLGCMLLVRSEIDGVPLMVRHLRISDLPSSTEENIEPRTRSWWERSLNVSIPRGPRWTDFGVMLLAADGRLLDERPVARRVERIEFALHVGDSPNPASVTVVGDRNPPPSLQEQDDAVSAAIKLETAARESAAHRRLSTAGELEQYLRWRFSCRGGELLVLDPHLLDRDAERALAFLRTLERPIRALCRSVTPKTAELIAETPGIDVRALPHGKQTLHDRVWIVGETGLLVGTSVSSFLADPEGRAQRASTATELPHADTTLWRTQFEAWWPAR